MNKDKFQKELISIFNTIQLDLEFLLKWHTQTLKQLEKLSEQRRNVSNPRHRGDSREDDFVKIIRSVFPMSLGISKGYAINCMSEKSREQDCIIHSMNDSAQLASTESISFLPIESIVSSVEIKSNLSTAETRKSVLNAVSLKKILNPGYAYFAAPKSGAKICYAIFAYDCTLSIKAMANQLTEISKEIPHHLLINMVYVLNKGLVIPATPEGEISTQAILNPKGAYMPIDSAEVQKSLPMSSATLFLWFLACLIDHSLLEAKERKSPEYFSYVNTPMDLSIRFKDIRDDPNKTKSNHANSADAKKRRG